MHILANKFLKRPSYHMHVHMYVYVRTHIHTNV